jgi:ribosomal protein RSM22 (predicted rRNA methylase)
MAQLPPELRARIDQEAEAAGPRRLNDCAAALSAAYRAGKPYNFRTAADCAAYAVTRLPATYAALCRVFASIPGTPASLLDLGAGPGTAAFAAADRFGPLERVTLFERDSALAALGRRLDAPATSWVLEDMRRPAAFPPHDLVLLSYSYGELERGDARRVLDRAWSAASACLTLVEPGTPAGFARILTAREQLLSLGAQIAAPCPHHNACPLSKPDWCHFAARVERTRHHRIAKEGALGWEDEKFSYLIATREPPDGAARVLRHPQVAKGFIQLRLCGAGGLATETITRKQGDRWRAARKAAWGDAWR